MLGFFMAAIYAAYLNNNDYYLTNIHGNRISRNYYS